jgi:hypothetical protein
LSIEEAPPEAPLPIELTMIVPQFQKFAAEGVLIGRLLAGYGSVESALSSCVAMGRNDIDMVLKAMFRARGETQRIDIADAIGRPSYRNLRMEAMFSEAIGDMRFCLKIRNQYSHCHWHDDLSGRLSFVDMEEIAKSNAIITIPFNLTFHYLDAQLLTEQEAYFEHIAQCLLYLNYEGRQRAGIISSHAFAKPKKVARPLLYLP